MALKEVDWYFSTLRMLAEDLTVMNRSIFELEDVFLMGILQLEVK
jgi:hypothetical protein